MRRILVLMLLFLIAVPTIPVNGAKSAPDTMLTDVLRETNTELIADILDPEHFDDSMQDVDLEDKPMLLVYSTLLFAHADKTIEDIISYAHSNDYASVVILEDNPTVLTEFLQKTKIGVGPSYDTVPTYIQDVLDGSANQTFLGNAHNITNVICFDASSSQLGTAVVYETDGGTFVRFYQDEYASAVEFTWESYQQYVTSYYKYITSYEQNYDSLGHAKSGTVTFLEYIKNPSQYTVSPRSDLSWVIIAVGSLSLLVAACAVAYFLIKSNNRRKQIN